MQDKTPRNEKGQRHGHWNESWGDLYCTAYFCNGQPFGYAEARSEITLFRTYYAR
jgi:hypothetical protein